MQCIIFGTSHIPKKKRLMHFLRKARDDKLFVFLDVPWRRSGDKNAWTGFKMIQTVIRKRIEIIKCETIPGSSCIRKEGSSLSLSTETSRHRRYSKGAYVIFLTVFQEGYTISRDIGARKSFLSSIHNPIERTDTFFVSNPLHPECCDKFLKIFQHHQQSRHK